MHTTMQTLGRFAIIGGTVLVSLVNVIMFTNVDNLDDAARIDLYADIYLYALIIPVISVAGVVLAHLQKPIMKHKTATIPKRIKPASKA